MASRRLAFVIATALAAALGLAACGSSGSSSSAKKVDLVAFSTPQSAYAALIPAFQATAAGKGVTFSQSYGASGDQSRAVLAGLPADVVHLALEPDVTKLADAGLVPSNWAAGPTKGMVTDSVVVMVVRPGNPKHITTWDDLVKPGVQVVTPNPVSSGGARWNIMAAYGAQLKEGKTPAEAEAYLAAMLKNTVAQPTSARDALQTFLAGKGDVLLDYESDAISAKAKGEPISYVIPDDTILIQNPIAIVNSGGHSATAKAFVNFLLGPDGQRIWAAQGYRPVISGIANPSQFPIPPGLFTIEYLHGWTVVTKQFFDPTTGIVTKIEQDLGTASG